MQNVAKLSIAVSAKQAASLRKAVKSGAYNSTSEVVREAIRVWDLQNQETEYLRKAWKEGIESGPAGPWNLDEFLKWARERKAKKKTPAKINGTKRR